MKFVGRLQDVEIVEDGAKHTLVLYNCKVPQTGELVFTAANAKCTANLKVKGELLLLQSSSFSKSFKFDLFYFLIFCFLLQQKQQELIKCKSDLEFLNQGKC